MASRDPSYAFNVPVYHFSAPADQVRAAAWARRQRIRCRKCVPEVRGETTTTYMAYGNDLPDWVISTLERLKGLRGDDNSASFDFEATETETTTGKLGGESTSELKGRADPSAFVVVVHICARICNPPLEIEIHKTYVPQHTTTRLQTRVRVWMPPAMTLMAPMIRPTFEKHFRGTDGDELARDIMVMRVVALVAVLCVKGGITGATFKKK